MLTKNVNYTARPNDVVVNRIGDTYRARVDLPTNIEEHINDEGEVHYTADVYSIDAGYTSNLAERVAADRDTWIARAAVELPPSPTIQDAIEAINALAEIVLGDEE